MRVFYLDDTFAHNGYTFTLISHPDFKQAFLLIYVASFGLRYGPAGISCLT